MTMTMTTKIDTRVAAAPPTEPDQATVSRFIALALRGLPAMLDQKRQLFCFTLQKTEQGMVQQGISQRYTAMTLLGLHRLAQGGGVSPIDTEPVFQALVSDLEWVDNVGDLGVLLWLCSVVCPERLAALESRLQIETALTRFRGARQGVTMELAWFLTGLSYWAQACPEKSKELEPLAVATYDILTKNQGERGFFGHLSKTRSLSGMARGRIGSFADQVYPIYGMAQFSKAYHHEEAAQRAVKCAMGICEEQGPMGQWWWHYDSSGGRVADGYPVFSVHQHAMGPMTLFGLGEVINRDFDAWIYKGLRWCNSKNELGYDMESASEAVIWRSIFRSRRSLARYLKAGFGNYSDAVEHESAENLKIRFECRPYELGWLLYAFGNRAFANRASGSSRNRETLGSTEPGAGAAGESKQ
jgi:hypothetical protein